MPHSCSGVAAPKPYLICLKSKCLSYEEREGRHQDKYDCMSPSRSDLIACHTLAFWSCGPYTVFQVYASATKIARVYYIFKQLKICSLWAFPGTAVIVFKIPLHFPI